METIISLPVNIIKKIEKGAQKYTYFSVKKMASAQRGKYLQDPLTDPSVNHLLTLFYSSYTRFLTIPVCKEYEILSVYNEYASQKHTENTLEKYNLLLSRFFNLHNIPKQENSLYFLAFTSPKHYIELPSPQEFANTLKEKPSSFDTFGWAYSSFLGFLKDSLSLLPSSLATREKVTERKFLLETRQTNIAEVKAKLSNLLIKHQAKPEVQEKKVRFFCFYRVDQ